MSDPNTTSDKRPVEANPPGTATAAAPSAAASTVDPLARLYHMSTTAGVATQEYVAINPTAIAALLLGFASVLVILTDMLLIIPAVALICAVVALMQVRRSNGTQTGTFFAASGLLLALLFGGGRVIHDAVIAFRTTNDERQVAGMMQQFGQLIASEQYEQAYQMTDARFRERVPFSQFKNAFSVYRQSAIGALKSIDWNGRRMQMEQSADGTVLYGMALFHFQSDPQPRRVVMQFTKSTGPWEIGDIPTMFPPAKRTK